MPRSLLPDLTPLRRSPEYRRLYTGFTLSNVGSQMAVVAVGLQVYDQTGSTAAVGLVGLFALVPLVVMGLYGGSLADHHDRRLVGLVATDRRLRRQHRRGGAGLGGQYLDVAALRHRRRLERCDGGLLPGTHEHLPAAAAARS